MVSERFLNVQMTFRRRNRVESGLDLIGVTDEGYERKSTENRRFREKEVILLAKITGTRGRPLQPFFVSQN